MIHQKKFRKGRFESYSFFGGQESRHVSSSGKSSISSSKPHPIKWLKLLPKRMEPFSQKMLTSRRKCLKRFFQAEHIEHNNDQFADAFYQEINNLYDDIKSSNFHPSEEITNRLTSSSALYCPVKPWEILLL